MKLIEKGLPADAPRPSMDPLTRQYMSNRDHACAQDMALRSITNTSGLQHFAARRLAGRLLADEVRFAIPFDDLPADGHWPLLE